MTHRRSTEHPNEANLGKLASGQVEAGSAAAREHLEEGCIVCATRMRPRLGHELRRLGGLLGKYFFTEQLTKEERRELSRRTLAWGSLRKAEARVAPALTEAILALPVAERHEEIRREPRYSSFELVLHLIESARAAGFRDPGQALELARLAREVAEGLERAGYPRRIAADAQALAWAMVANGHRIATELIDAERAMRSSRQLLAEGTGHPDVRAEILSLLGSLRTTEARFTDAVKVLEEAAAIYRAYGNLELEAKTLMKLGNAAGESGQVERAAELLGQARERLGWDAEGELSVGAAQAHVHWLLEAGDTEAARRVMETVQEETRGREVSFYWRQRLDWVGARLTWAEGDLAGAEAGLEAVRERYGESEQAYRYCLVSLDKAQLLLEQGRTAEVRRLADEMLPVFRSRRIHHHALQALVLFQKAAEAESATITLVQQLTRYLRHAQNNPHLVYPSFA